jgi:hypothetical protein
LKSPQPDAANFIDLQDLLHPALLRRLVGPQAEQAGSMTEPPVGNMVERDLDDEFRAQPFPLRGAFG